MSKISTARKNRQKLDAMEYLQNDKLIARSCYRARKAYDLAIQALQKQIPEKVEFEETGDSYPNCEPQYAAVCPRCGNVLIHFDMRNFSCINVNSRTETTHFAEPDDDAEHFFHLHMQWHDYSGQNTYCGRCGQKLRWK